VRLFRTLLIVLALLVGGGAAAAWFVPPQLDLNAYRGEIAELASARLGRDVRIGGKIRFRLLPEPTVTASDVSLGGTGGGVRVTASQLRLRVALAPLLSGRVDARELVLRGAELRLPWPLDPAVLRLRRPSWLAAVSARVEDGRLLVGKLAVTGIDGTLVTDAYTGTYTVAGTGRFSGTPWHFTARLTQPGIDGSAGLDMTLDGQGRVQGVGGTLAGQFAPDGSFTGHIAARGPDLSRLLPAPAVPFSAEGRITVAGGLAAADDLALQIGRSPARGAVALRVTPTARLDVALAASRIDLDAWLPVLVRPDLSDLPTGIDLSAEAASLAGGMLRGLRAAVDLTPGGAVLREARAMLPGDASLRLAGRVLPATAGILGPRFEGDAALTAPALRTTLDWIARAGVTPLAALPEGVLHSATLAAHVVADPVQVAISNLDAEVDGSHVLGSLTLHGGNHFSLGAGLSVDRVELDPWLPATPPRLPDLPARFARFDWNLRLDAKRAVLRGITFAPLALDAGAEGGRVVLRKLDLMLNGAHASASASVAEGGRVTEGRLDLQAPHAGALAALLPDQLAFLGRKAPALWQTAAAVQVLGSGAPDSLALKVTADLGDLRLEAQPTFDLAHQTFKATATLRHPGAPRLLQALGIEGVPGWLGDGSLGLVAQLSGAPGKLAADNFDLTAGLLHATGALLLDREGSVPVLTGHVDTETLPLPLPNPRTPSPLPLEALRGWSGSVQVQAARVLANLRPMLQQATATLSLSHGVLRLDDLAAKLGGGALAASASIDTAAEPPAAAVHLALTSATVSEPVFDLPLDLAAGRLDAGADLTATGHAPATLLATLSGDIRLDATAGTLAGVSLAKAAGELSDAAVAAALGGGATAFDRLHITAHADRGVVTIREGRLSAPSGSVAITGTIDLPDQTIDLRAGLRPAMPDAPEIGVRLSGKPDTVYRTPELADLTRWRAAQTAPPSEPAPAIPQ
jgi:hypothetical protein